MAGQALPGVHQARVGQIEADFNFAVRNQCIDMFGFADKPDMDFKYLVDQGIINPLPAPVVCGRLARAACS